MSIKGGQKLIFKGKRKYPRNHNIKSTKCCELKNLFCRIRVKFLRYFLFFFNKKIKILRDDRDTYVKIIWKNVIDGANSDFDKISSVGLSNYGEPYDFFSVMHYEATGRFLFRYA
jgi:hypothetical protein